MADTNGNGGKGWVYTFLTGLAITFVGGTLKNLADVSALKEAQSGTQNSIQRIEKEMERMAGKLDRVLEKK